MSSRQKHHHLKHGFACMVLLMIALASATPGFGQRNKKNYFQKKRPAEWSLGFGAANFLGDLGGRDMIGSEFVWDLEFAATGLSAQGSYMYFYNHRAGFRTSFTWAKLKGDDALTQEIFRHNRNLHFKSNLFEISTVWEYHFIREKIGHKHDLRDQRMRLIGLKGRSTGAYIFGGIGGFYFNPRAQIEGTWVALRPLGTEGQGLAGGPKQYSRFNVSFPVGAGLRFARSNRLTFSLSLSYRFTLTDYLDDVSGTYYDNVTIEQIRGPVAAYLADPNLGSEEVGWEPQGTLEGQQRGDPTDNDGFFVAHFSLNYKIKPSRSARKRRFYRASINQRIKF